MTIPIEAPDIVLYALGSNGQPHRVPDPCFPPNNPDQDIIAILVSYLEQLPGESFRFVSPGADRVTLVEKRWDENGVMLVFTDREHEFRLTATRRRR
jgi:hypothetical protein